VTKEGQEMSGEGNEENKLDREELKENPLEELEELWEKGSESVGGKAIVRTRFLESLNIVQYKKKNPYEESNGTVKIQKLYSFLNRYLHREMATRTIGSK